MTDEIICTLCNRVSDDAGVCNRCHRRLTYQLEELLELWEEAHFELTPGKGGHGSHSSERTIGLNVAALSFIEGSDILGFCHEWEKLIRAERQLTPPALLPKKDRYSELTDAIRFQVAHLDWSIEQPWINDFARELRHLHGTGTAAARRFIEKVRRIPCPADNAEGLPCAVMLPIADDQERLLDLFECRGCGTQWTTIRLIAVALSDPGREVWLDAEAIAGYIGVVPRYIHTFAKRHGLSKRGQRYNLSEVMAVRKAI